MKRPIKFTTKENPDTVDFVATFIVEPFKLVNGLPFSATEIIYAERMPKGSILDDKWKNKAGQKIEKKLSEKR